MINVRTFNENPLLSKIRYEAGKALSGELYTKEVGIFKLFTDERLNKLNSLDPLVYYGLFIQVDEKRIEKYVDELYPIRGYINFYNYILLLIYEENKDIKQTHHLSFLMDEVFGYLEYRESVSTLIEYYYAIYNNINFIMNDDDILPSSAK